MEISSAPGSPTSQIKVSPGGRYFIDNHNQPFFWLGDTQWELFRLFSPGTAKKILSDRQAKGFNIILVMLTGVKAWWDQSNQQHEYVNLEGEDPWIDGDPLKPNERYFRHIDPIIRLGQQAGQVFVVGIYHQWHVNEIPVQKARAWARWVAHRYRDMPNLIWSMYPKAQESYLPVCRELAAGLLEGDGGAHLISVHPDPSVASSSFIHEEPWLGFNMIQTCVDYDQIHAMVSKDYHRNPIKPVIMAEGGYEGLEFDKLQTPHHIRKQAYWTQLAGGYHVYGHNESWQNPLAWSQWLDSPGSSQLKVFREIITSLKEWWHLVPDQSLLTTGMGSGYRLNVAARAQAGDLILVYLSEPSSVQVRLDSLSCGGAAHAYWIDPRDGSRSHPWTISTENTMSFTSPNGHEDSLLLIDAE